MSRKTKDDVTQPITAESLAERFKNFPALQLLERRFANPNDPGSLPILLLDEDPNACINTEHHNRLKGGETTCRTRDTQTGRICGRPVRRWYVRWGNMAQEGRSAQLRAKAYVAVELKELLNADDVADLYRSQNDRNPLVRRGDRGQEILMKMPLEAFIYVKTVQREQRMKDARSKTKLMAQLANRAGTELGDEAGETVHRGGISVESFKVSRSTLGEEAGVDE